MVHAKAPMSDVADGLAGATDGAGDPEPWADTVAELKATTAKLTVAAMIVGRPVIRCECPCMGTSQ